PPHGNSQNYGGPDWFTYTIGDPQGNTGMATVSVQIEPVNDDPIARDDAAQTAPGVPLTLTNLTANDYDIEFPYALTLDAVATSSTAGGTIVDHGDGSVTYTPPPGFVDAVDTFWYTIIDGDGGTATATVRIVVGEVVVTEVVHHTLDSGPGSLRQALLNAQTNVGHTRIVFEIPPSDPNFLDIDAGLPGGDAAGDVYVIRPQSILPPLTNSLFPTTIDGSSQAAFGGQTNPHGPQIVLDGANRLWAGLLVYSDANRIEGLNIHSFTSYAVGLFGGEHNQISGNFIGTDPRGAADRGGYHGVYVSSGSRGNWIGTNGDGAGDDQEGNLISGNYMGVTLWRTHDNVVAGNRIGTDASGSYAIPNGGNGVYIASGSGGNWIGTNGDGLADRAEGNLISGNSFAGVNIFASDNRVAGNRIGTNLAGTAPLGNGQGVIVQAGGSGNRIGTNGDGLADDVEGNLISGNRRGISFYAGHQNTVAGNIIGLNATGTARLGNTQQGIFIGSGSTANRIGTNGDGIADAAEGNLISGNALDGIRIDFSNHNDVAGNLIGTDVEGTRDLGNGADGVHIRQSSLGTRVGTNGDGVADAAEGNLISGNRRGVTITRAYETIVAGNHIGVDLTGTAALGNDEYGVLLNNNSQANVIGTRGDGVADEAEGNVISGNGTNGVSVYASSHNVVAGNRIGTDATGTQRIGNRYHGVLVQINAQHNRIGTNADQVGDEAERNVIAANGLAGVYLYGAQHNVVAGNFIGTAADGNSPLGNSQYGVRLQSASGSVANHNQIGGTEAGAGNRIAFNQGAGIRIFSGEGNTLAANAIFANGQLGIDLDSEGVTANDLGDVDGGANRRMNFPGLDRVLVSASAVTVSGTLLATPNSLFRVELFASDAADWTQYGEGQHYLGAVTTATDPQGNAAFVAHLPQPVLLGQQITATATHLSHGDTSEFSAALIADTAQSTANLAPQASDNAYTIDEDTPLTGNLLTDGSPDIDPDGDPLWLVATPTSGPHHGSLTLNRDGTFTYTPHADFSGSDLFLYEVVDFRGGSDTAEVTITVQPLADPPQASWDQVTTLIDQPLRFNVLTNDRDADGDPLVVTAWDPTGLAGGRVTSHGGGDFTYTPPPGFYGLDRWNYTVADGTGQTATASVEVVVARPLDTDRDGLWDDEETFYFGTDPLKYDTDGDRLRDGFEARSVYLDPLVADDPQADPDGDQASHLQEAIYGSDPDLFDSDGDGVADGMEIAQGSNPIDAADLGQPPAAGAVVWFQLTVGDHSGSQSETYDLKVGPITHQATYPGVVATGSYS
ncbi:MAG: tandem-95 repeat protein, partial [Planctomycetales bacterium]|nr:tandem-95 repeat protein [Planctomycetales bacterium]